MNKRLILNLVLIVAGLGLLVALNGLSGTVAPVQAQTPPSPSPSPSPTPEPTPSPTPTPTPTPSPTPSGTPCSPGYWRHHTTEFNSVCGAAASGAPSYLDSCEELFDAIWCKGSNASCHRSEATDLLNGVSGCFE